MRSVALAALVACHATPTKPATFDLAYTLERAADGVRVIVTTTAAESGNTQLQLEESLWYEHPDDAITNVAATVDGEPTIVVHDGVHWLVHAPAGAPLVFSYTIVPVPWDRHHSEFGPVAGEHFIHLNGETTLIWPKHLDDAAPKRIAIFWRGWQEVGWRTASSYGTHASAIVDEHLREFIHAAFVASDRLEVIEHGGLAVAVVAADWKFAPHELADATAKLVQTEWKFMRERAPAYFFADLVPFPTGHGTGLNHSLSVLTGPDTPFHHVAFTIAHEVFHHWNGLVLDPEPEWFREGFTNYYARKLVRRAGVYGLEDTVANLDDELRRYEQSPYRDLGDAAAAERTAQDPGVQLMVYARGDLIALLLDLELRKHHKSLDDLMRALVAEPPRDLSRAHLLQIFERATSPAFASRITVLLDRGGPIDIDPAALAPCLEVEPAPVLQFHVADARACDALF